MILDLIALDPTSRVWLYQADRELSYDELDDARELLFDFLSEWTAHRQELHTYGNIFHRRFLGLFVDESQAAGASGCSIDSSVRFVQQLGERMDINFFERTAYAYMDAQEVIHPIGHADLGTAYSSGQITDDTLFFDNLVKTKEQFLKSWLVPLKDSWHSRFL